MGHARAAEDRPDRWLIRSVIDAEAEFLYVPAADVLAVADREGAISFDAPDARFTHRDGCARSRSCSRTSASPIRRSPASAASSTALTSPRTATRHPNHAVCSRWRRASTCSSSTTSDQLELSLPVYDALYAWCRNEVSAG